MEQELISKRELLELTGISYGQLYRWKRKGLIPEEWFQKKSAYTGQETFFPRSQVLSRIAKIKCLKEDVSLDDLKDVFSPDFGDLSLSPQQAVERNIASAETMRLYLDDTGGEQPLGFAELLHVHLFSGLLVSGNLSLGEARQTLDVLRTAAIRCAGVPHALLLARKLGVFCCFALSAPSEVCLDRDTRLIERVELQAATEELKLKLGDWYHE